MISLRVVALDSDAYPRLSWSSGLLTDEGFYIHNARNVVLFGKERTDGFNNMLIMPVLHVVQVVVFRLFGVGAVQARLISVASCLLTLPLFFDALRRVFGIRVAYVATIFLGLDHINLLYTRLALMDTPASALMICTLYTFTRGLPCPSRDHACHEKRNSCGIAWMALSGVMLGLCCATRGLTALVVPCFLGSLWMGLSDLPAEARLAHRAAAIIGLILSVLTFVLLWYLPHRTEITQMNRYYIFHLLVPHSLAGFGNNVLMGLFDYQRGAMPYLLRHSPVQFALACAGLGWVIVTWAGRQKRAGIREGTSLARPARAVLCLLAGWIFVFWLFVCFVNYAPSRYYVLFYPAMAALSAVTLLELPRIGGEIIEHKVLLAILSSYLICITRQALLTQMEPAAAPIAPKGMSALFWAMAAALFVGSQLGRKQNVSMRNRYAKGEQPPEIWIAGIVVWAAVNCYWTGDWLLHLTYRQRAADRWLGANLPTGSTLIGAVAPGLCLNNHFKAVTMIPNLCNDGSIVEQSLPPRYILILDSEFPPQSGRWREKWWDARYPDLVAPSHCLYTFHKILRPFLKIGVYCVDAPAASSPGTRFKRAPD